MRVFALFLSLLFISSSANAASPVDTTFIDQFSSPILNPIWEIIRNDSTHWSLTSPSGYLTITSQYGEFASPSYPEPANIFLCNTSQPFSSFETRLIFAPTENFQQAGLIVYLNDTVYLKLDRISASNAPSQNQNIEFVSSNFRIWYPITADTLYLRLTTIDTTVMASCSVDGTNYNIIGTFTNAKGLGKYKIGIFTMNGGVPTSSDIPAEFDYFKAEWLDSLAAPVLLSPINNALNVSINANLSWNSSSSATSYRVQLSNTTSFLLTNDTIVSGNSRLISSLATSSLYYWRVYATNGLGNSPWSSIWSFTTISMPSTPVLSYPSNGSTSIPISTTLSWDTVSSAASYRIQISNSTAFWIVNDTTTSLSNRAASLVSNTMYHWRVYSINDAGNSAWSKVFSFFTGTTFALAAHSQMANQSFFITGNMVNYSLEAPCLVAINYYDINGRRVMSLINRYQNAGKYSFIIPKDNLPAGTYLQSFKAGDKSQMNKIVIAR